MFLRKADSEKRGKKRNKKSCKQSILDWSCEGESEYFGRGLHAVVLQRVRKETTQLVLRILHTFTRSTWHMSAAALLLMETAVSEPGASHSVTSPAGWQTELPEISKCNSDCSSIGNHQLKKEHRSSGTTVDPSPPCTLQVVQLSYTSAQFL